MRYLLLFLGTLGFLACGPQTHFQRSEKKVLLFTANPTEVESATSSVEAAAIQLLRTDQPDYLREDSLWQFSTVILHEIALESLSPYQQQNLQRYVQAGNGLFLLNTSLSTPLTWPWIDSLGLVQGANATGQKVKDGGTTVAGFVRREYGGGRLVVGTQQEDSTPDLLESLNYLIGDNAYDLDQISLPAAPLPDRFSKVILDDLDVNEPMELAVLPDGRVLFIERRGKMKLYSPQTGKSKTIATFDVCTEGNYEDGMLGLAADPDFAQNGNIYLYYSPPCEINEQYLSRFTLSGDSILLASEKVILKVGVQRETCCHSGGSVAFGPDGNLYLSTGDNTSSKESDGYSPLDTRPGRSPFDSQKSSGNTQDLRGKILRIRPNADASYDIPEGNLFPKDGSEGRPEIYVMGARNPFRIAVDAKTRFVYWGDVGPDAGSPGKYGRESYDEWNQARKPGNFGWPYFMGNNIAFPFRDFAADTVGPLYDPAHPVNRSPNNTGSQELPRANPAYIWYSKAPSAEFPMLGRGSNSAMAGPIYYEPATAADSRVKLPEYFSGKWFIYEWARSWVQVVTMDEQGNLVKIEPFLPEGDFDKPIEMEIGPDGAIYMLEYGANYFMNNPTARLVRIEYASGNRLPVPRFTLSQNAGAAPFTVEFDASGSYDPDEGDALRYDWSFTEANAVQATGEQVSYTFTQPGIYPVTLTTTDAQNESASTQLTLQVGNAPPTIDLAAEGNQSFFFAGTEREYSFTIHDPEDEAKGGLNREALKINFLYVPDGEDLEVMLGENRAIDGSFRFAGGLNLIRNSDCKSCHDPVLQSVGPSYQMVAEKYYGQQTAVGYLANKVLTGGNGVWGEKIMAGHPQHTLAETQEMARYILSLADKGSQGALPEQGKMVFPQHQSDPQGAYLLAASYTDAGGGPIAPLSTRKTLVLRAPYLYADRNVAEHKVGRRILGDNRSRDKTVLTNIQHGAWVAFTAFDWTEIGALQLTLKSVEGGEILVRQEDQNGAIIGSVKLGGKGRDSDWQEVRIPVSPERGFHMLYLEFRNEAKAEARDLFWLDVIRLEQLNS